MEQYFKQCCTSEELKKEYKRLVFLFHPDRGGDTETMQAINAEYERFFELLKNKHRNAEGEMYEKDTDETPEEFRDILMKIIKLHGVDAEICGSWVWLTGNTLEYKEYLKQCGFRWSGGKKAWYWHSGEYRKKSKKTLSLNDIREMYGSEKVKREEPEETKKIAAK